MNVTVLRADLPLCCDAYVHSLEEIHRTYPERLVYVCTRCGIVVKYNLYESVESLERAGKVSKNSVRFDPPASVEEDIGSEPC